MSKIKYKSGYKYQLDEQYVVMLPELRSAMSSTGAFATGFDNGFISWNGEKGRVTFMRGYAWDGCSGPTIDCRESMRASLIHDGLYQLIREGTIHKNYRVLADKLFFQALLADGFWKWRAWAYYQAVRKFGPKDGGEIREVHLAP